MFPRLLVLTNPCQSKRILKLTRNEIWTKQFGTIGDDRAYDIFVESDYFFIGGYTTGSLFDINLGGEDAFICKYDLDGIPVWTRQFGSPLDEKIHEISIFSKSPKIRLRERGLTKGI